MQAVNDGLFSLQKFVSKALQNQSILTAIAVTSALSP
jgi:hypothetical protein